MAQRQAHYIRPNDTSRIPRRHVIIDTEARIQKAGKTSVQEWLCGAASFCTRKADGEWRVSYQTYTTPSDLWDEIASFTVSRERTVVWTHNAAYDIRVSQAIPQLQGMDFELKDIRLSQHGAWGKWMRNRGSLVVVDSLAVWNVPLETLARAFDTQPLTYPKSDDPAAWQAKCLRDVEILTTAVTSYIGWLIDADMGSWQVTGAGQAWSAWRHKHYTHKVLVADDLDARSAVRTAAWAGRTEAWTYGTDQTATVYDLDFQNAYPRIAAEVSVPVRQYGKAQVSTLGGLLKLAGRFAVLAEVEVTTDQPVVPTQRGQHIVWPVGTFTTTLWDPELRLLQDVGATVRVVQTWLYKKAPALRQWATWILGELHKPDDEVPRWLKLVLKHWSRALIGRFAMRYKAWTEFGECSQPDVRMISGYDIDEEAPFTYLQVGTRILELGEEVDGRDSVPEITGYIMSEGRARLWASAMLIGEENIHYMDTDSILCTAEGYRRAQMHKDRPELSGLRLKRKFRGYSIAGPRQMIVGGEAKIAGVPKHSRRVDEWTFEGEVWRGLDESIRHGELTSVKVTSRTFRVMKTDTRRQRNGQGRTIPFEVGNGEGNTSQSGTKAAV